MADITNAKKRVNFSYFFFFLRNNFCSDIHYEIHLELKCLSKHWFGCVMAQRCNNCIAGDHILLSSQWILDGGQW